MSDTPLKLNDFGVPELPPLSPEEEKKAKIEQKNYLAMLEREWEAKKPEIEQAEQRERERQKQETEWRTGNGGVPLPTDRLRAGDVPGRYGSNEDPYEEMTRQLQNIAEYSPLNFPLGSLFSTTKPDSLGKDYTKPLYDLVVQYSDKPHAEMVNKAHAAFNIARIRGSRTGNIYQNEEKIDKLNPSARDLRSNGYQQESTTAQLDELNKTGRKEEKSLEAYQTLQTLRSLNKRWEQPGAKEADLLQSYLNVDGWRPSLNDLSHAQKDRYIEQFKKEHGKEWEQINRPGATAEQISQALQPYLDSEGWRGISISDLSSDQQKKTKEQFINRLETLYHKAGYGSFKSRVGNWVDDVLGGLDKDAFNAINTTLGTNLDASYIDKKDEIKKIILDALQDKYPNAPEKLEVFLQAVQHSDIGLSSDNPLKTYKNPKDTYLQDTITGLSRSIEEYHREHAQLESRLKQFQGEKNKLEKQAAALPALTKARIADLKTAIAKERKADQGAYKTGREPTIQDIIPEARAREFERAYHNEQIKNDYTRSFYAQNDQGNLAVLAVISNINYAVLSNTQRVNIAANDPQAPVKIAGAEAVTLTTPSLKPFTCTEVDGVATVAQMVDGKDGLVFRELPQKSNTITFGNPGKKRNIHLDVADGVRVDLTDLKQAAIQPYDAGNPHHQIVMHGAGEVILSGKTGAQSPDFSLSVMDSGHNGKPVVISIPSNTNLQAYDINFNAADPAKKHSKNLTMDLQGKIYVPLENTMDYVKKIANPINIDLAVRPANGRGEPVRIPVVRNGVAVDTPANIAARVRLESIATAPGVFAVASPENFYVRLDDTLKVHALANNGSGNMILGMTQTQKDAAIRTLKTNPVDGVEYYEINFVGRDGKRYLVNLQEKAQILMVNEKGEALGQPQSVKEALKDATGQQRNGWAKAVLDITQSVDKDRNGAFSGDELKALQKSPRFQQLIDTMKKLIASFDNGDGILSNQEQAKAAEAMRNDSAVARVFGLDGQKKLDIKTVGDALVTYAKGYNVKLNLKTVSDNSAPAAGPSSGPKNRETGL